MHKLEKIAEENIIIKLIFSSFLKKQINGVLKLGTGDVGFQNRIFQ